MKRLLLKICLVIFRRYGSLTVEIAENKKDELADGIRNCPKGKSVRLEMKRGTVDFEII